MPFVNCPARPDDEFTKMNKALIAAVCFMSVHFSNNKIGERMIPPPIPIRPERKPIAAPIKRDKYGFDFFNSSVLIFVKNKNLIMGTNNNMPSIFL
jgi:hypothetical protein